MCEDHLYWAGLHARWMVDENFDKGPRRFFDAVPSPLRPLVVLMTRRQVRRNLWAHGMGRHTTTEMDQLAVRDIGAIADFLAQKPYLWARSHAAPMPLSFPSWLTRFAHSLRRQFERAPSSDPISSPIAIA